MTALEALLLGILQGATEFLPVSSSGHLVLGEHLLALKPTLAFNAALHAGTLVAVVGYYRRDLWDMLRETVRSLIGLIGGRSPGAIWAEDHGTRLALLILLATVPTGLIGLGLKGPVERSMENGLYTSLALLVTGALLICTRWAREAGPGGAGAQGAQGAQGALGAQGAQGALGPAEAPGGAGDGPDAARPGPTRVTAQIALAVGVAQGIAVVPGISRSGATLAVILLLGVRRPDAARFCFLLSVPAILGALVLEGKALGRMGSEDLGPLALGVGAAVVVGYLSLAMLVALVRRGRLHLFAAYVLPLALLGIVYFSSR